MIKKINCVDLSFKRANKARFDSDSDRRSKIIFKINPDTESSLDLQKNYNIIQINFREKDFQLGEDFELINQNTIDKVLPLYKKYQEGMNQKVDDEKLREFISTLLKNNDKIFVVKEENDPAGFIHVSDSYSTIDMKPFATIQAVFVSHEHRGKGLSKKLINKVKDWTTSKNYKGIFVKTLANNATSCAMYKGLDFKDESNKYGVFFWPNDKILDYSKGYVNTIDKNN